MQFESRVLVWAKWNMLLFEDPILASSCAYLLGDFAKACNVSGAQFYHLLSEGFLFFTAQYYF